MNGFAWNIRYTLGVGGISKISDKMYLNWGIKPVGLHFLGYGKYTNYSYILNDYGYYNLIGNMDNTWGFGICGSLDFGLGIKTNKKLVINPYIRCSYALDFREWRYKLYRYYKNISVFPITLQAGVSFSFLNYRIEKNKYPKKTAKLANSSKIGGTNKSIFTPTF